MKSLLLFVSLIGTLLISSTRADERPTIRVGSKVFVESYILAEIIAQEIEASGLAKVERRFGLGNTGITQESLVEGEIDIYPEYTGTIWQVILKRDPVPGSSLQIALASIGLHSSESFGFDNSYALAMTRKRAMALGVETISDLKEHPNLKAAFSYEFIKRRDGLEKLKSVYDLILSETKGMEHTLVYQALDSGKVDLIEVYTTDAMLTQLDLLILKDDKNFFPLYEGVALTRTDFVDRYPKIWELVQGLEGKFTNKRVSKMNSWVTNDKRTYQTVATQFRTGVKSNQKTSAFNGKALWKATLEHLRLVGVSLVLAIAFGVPLGILANRNRVLEQVVLLSIGTVQTIPSLALLCFLIPIFGIGLIPSLVALFLYALLPIVRSTYTGLRSIEPALIDSAKALGLSTAQRLRLIEIPMASIHILSGVKTSAIINVGTATLAALIGAGGYGKLITTGLSLNSIPIILSGALPAALMAVAFHGVFEVIDRIIVPQGLRK